jgi:hypothetical protein
MAEDQMSMAKQQSTTFRGAAAVSSVLLIILLLAAQLAWSNKPDRDSYLIIWNSSGLDVRFEQVVIDDQVIWGGAETFLSKEHLRQHLPHSGRDSVSFSFRSSTGPVQLKLTTINELEERETVSCTLDDPPVSGRFRGFFGMGCRFRAYYYKGRLLCSDCENPIP